MENCLGEDIPIGIYRTYDNIRNLKIKVKLRKIANACFVEKDPLVFRDSKDLELVDLIKSPSVSVEHTFSWQEKVLRNEAPADANVSRIEEVVSNQSEGLCLFSYTDAEVLSPTWKKPSKIPNGASSALEKRLLTIKPTTKLHTCDMESWKKSLKQNSKSILRDSNKLSQQSIEYGQTMVIMAGISFNDSSAFEEIELCFLQLDGHGTLTINPDFNSGKPFIFINNRSETFEYEIENVSSSMTESALQREKYLMRKILQYKKKIKDGAASLEFEKNLTGNSKFMLNFEIVSAQNFLSPDIFVHYMIILPKGYTSESCLEGVTETSRSKFKKNIRVAYYGYLFSLDLVTDNSDESLCDHSVKIVCEVTSVDCWGNFRNEGYGYGNILPTPGYQKIDIYTWKIQPTSLRNRLQNFFIGGTPTLQDLSYIVDSNEPKCSQLSKYGVHTESSGSVSLKFYVLKECKIES